jgi:hypothetical protein
VVDYKTARVFLLLILAQAAHSVEEYETKLYAVFPPAHFVSSLISHDLRLGFLIGNAALVAFGLWCWAVPVRLRWIFAPEVVWFWIVLELANGITHVTLASLNRGYFPGLITAPVLIAVAIWLARVQLRVRE